MADETRELTPSERFHALLDSITPEMLDAVDRKLNDPNYVPREVAWREDSDPFGRDWDWLSPDPNGERSEESASV